MKNPDTVMLPENCFYTAEHVWICPDGDAYVVGITDFAQDQLGEIAFVDLPAPGDSLEAGDEFGTVESIKSVNQLYMPVAGEILAINEELESAPTVANVSPYENGWMIRLRPANANDVQALLNAADYRKQLA